MQFQVNFLNNNDWREVNSDGYIIGIKQGWEVRPAPIMYQGAIVIGLRKMQGEYWVLLHVEGEADVNWVRCEDDDVLHACVSAMGE